jgi:hypothetical protein
MTSACRQPVHTLASATEEPISRVELRAWRRQLVDGQPLAQGEVLEGELAVAAGEEGEEPEQVEYEGEHEPGLWPERTDRSITWLADDNGAICPSTGGQLARWALLGAGS